MLSLIQLSKTDLYISERSKLWEPFLCTEVQQELLVAESTQRECILKYVFFPTNIMDNVLPKTFFSTFSSLLAYIQVFHTPQEGV